MKRRTFSAATLYAATLGSLSIGASKLAQAQVAGAIGSCPVGTTLGGTNLSGMEWARPGLRYGASTAPNIHFTVPRAADVSYLANNGFDKNRLPIQWELLQPMLHDTPANASVQNVVGAPGAFNAQYAAYIMSVLDAHAAAGIKCIIDLHNYARYQDFVYQPDGSVLGLVVPPSPTVRPYTTNNTQVQVRIFSLAQNATLKIANFVDFWSRAAQLWKNHPGFGGYGLMNEPYALPKVGGTQAVDSYPPYTDKQDYSISNQFSQAAVNAIRAIDSTNPIYVGGNEYSNAMGIATQNPGYPLQGSNIIYEVHMYLDAASNGNAFDYDTEVAKGFSAGLTGPISQTTGRDRIKIAIDWAKSKGVKLALTEVGMPVDDIRWQTMFKLATDYAASEGCEIYSWMGGNHWAIHGYAINHVPNWHQNKTQEPLVSGVLKSSFRKAQASVFDDSRSFSTGAAVEVKVYVRGNLASPFKINVSSNNGGTFS